MLAALAIFADSPAAQLEALAGPSFPLIAPPDRPNHFLLTMRYPPLSDLLVRLARRADVPAIVSLLADDPLGSTREQPGEPLAQAYFDAFDAIAAQSGNEVLVAEAASEVAGCLQLTVIPGLSRSGMTRGQLEGVRVGARFRGRGIGEALVRAALERARGHGCRLVQLTTDRSRTDAQRFYERLGFEASHIGMKLTLG